MYSEIIVSNTNHESKFWTRHLDSDLSANGEDIINVMQRARNSPGNFIYVTHEAARKKMIILSRMLMHLQCFIIKGRGANVLHIR